MTIDPNALLENLRSAPRAITIPCLLFAGILVLAGIAALMPHRHATLPTPAPHRAPAMAAPVVQSQGTPQATAPAATVRKQPAVPSSNASASPATAVLPVPAKAGTAAPPAIDVSAMRVVLPGAAQPLNLREQRAAYSVEAAQRRGYGEYGPTVQIGAATVESRASAFASLPVKALNTGLPTEGRASESWTFWTQVKNAGTHVFALRLDSGMATASLLIDGQTKPVAEVQGYGNEVETGIGTADLGTGWHTLTVRLIHSVSSESAPGSVSASLFVRGPTDSAPHSILPYAVAQSSAKPASAASVATVPKVAK